MSKDTVHKRKESFESSDQLSRRYVPSFTPVSLWDKKWELSFTSRFKVPGKEVGVIRELFSVVLKQLFTQEEIFVYEDRLYHSYWDLIINFLYERGILLEKGISVKLNPFDGPQLFRFQVTGVSKQGMEKDERRFIHGAGSSLDSEEAISKAFGEFLERYFLAQYDKKDITKSSIGALVKKKTPFLHPATIAESSEEQKKEFPERQFDNESMFSWVEGYSLTKKRKTLLPAQAAIWRYALGNGEPFLRERNSNGAGGFFTREGAILSGLYELIQRDAFLVWWLSGNAPGKVSLKSIIDKETRQYVAMIERFNIEVHILETTTDIKVPAYTVILVDRVKNGVTVGAGAARSSRKAILQALNEALSIHLSLMTKTTFFEDLEMPENLEVFKSPLGLQQRIKFWGDVKRIPDIEFFLKGEEKSYATCVQSDSSVISEAEEIGWLCDLLAKHEKPFEAFVYEKEHPVLEALGFHVAQVIIPGLMFMYLTEKNAPLASTRVRQAMEGLGEKVRDMWTHIPHPFA